MAPRLVEDAYNVADAVVVGNLLISLLRHSDRVTAACQAQLVNMIAPIRTEPDGPAWRQTIFHPFALTSRLARGTVLRLRVDSATYRTARYGEVPLIDAVATHDGDSGDVTVFAVNRHRTETAELTVARGLTNTEIADHLHISLSTVKTHLASLMAKLGARNRVEIAMWAYETHRIVPGR